MEQRDETRRRPLWPWAVLAGAGYVLIYRVVAPQLIYMSALVALLLSFLFHLVLVFAFLIAAHRLSRFVRRVLGMALRQRWSTAHFLATTLVAASIMSLMQMFCIVWYWWGYPLPGASFFLLRTPEERWYLFLSVVFIGAILSVLALVDAGISYRPEAAAESPDLSARSLVTSHGVIGGLTLAIASLAFYMLLLGGALYYFPKERDPALAGYWRNVTNPYPPRGIYFEQDGTGYGVRGFSRFHWATEGGRLHLIYQGGHGMGKSTYPYTLVTGSDGVRLVTQGDPYPLPAALLWTGSEPPLQLPSASQMSDAAATISSKPFPTRAVVLFERSLQKVTVSLYQADATGVIGSGVPSQGRLLQTITFGSYSVDSAQELKQAEGVTLPQPVAQGLVKWLFTRAHDRMTKVAAEARIEYGVELEPSGSQWHALIWDLPAKPGGQVSFTVRADGSIVDVSPGS